MGKLLLSQEKGKDSEKNRIEFIYPYLIPVTFLVSWKELKNSKYEE